MSVSVLCTFVKGSIKKKSQSWDIVPTGGGGDVPTCLFGYFFGGVKLQLCEEKNPDLTKSQKIVA
jgi:hypothetical protein